MPTIHQSLLRITSRFVLFCMIVVCRCGFIAVEQPRSSLMPKYVYFKDLAANLEKFLEWSHVNLCLDKQTKSIGKTMLGVVFEKCYIFWSQWYDVVLSEARYPVCTVLSWMGKFGHFTAKPTTLFGIWSGPPKNKLSVKTVVSKA